MRREAPRKATGKAAVLAVSKKVDKDVAAGTGSPKSVGRTTTTTIRMTRSPSTLNPFTSGTGGHCMASKYLGPRYWMDHWRANCLWHVSSYYLGLCVPPLLMAIAWRRIKVIVGCGAILGIMWLLME